MCNQKVPLMAQKKFWSLELQPVSDWLLVSPVLLAQVPLLLAFSLKKSRQKEKQQLRVGTTQPLLKQKLTKPDFTQKVSMAMLFLMKSNKKQSI